MVQSLISVLTGFAVIYIAHILIWRLSPSNSPRIILLGFLALAGLALSALIQFFQTGWDPHPLFFVISMGSLLSIFYAYFYSGICRSVSVTLLVNLLTRGNKTVGAHVLKDEYAASSRFEDRLEVMRQVGWISIAGEQVSLTVKGRRIAGVVRVVSFILCGGLEG